MNSNRKPGNYPSILITISLTVALFLIGFCGWIAISSVELIKYIKQNIEVQVYLDNDLNKTQIQEVEKEIEKLNILDTSKPDAIRFISKDETAKEFFDNTKENYNEILGSNPFHDALSLVLKEDELEPQKLSNLKLKLEQVPGVFEVDYAKDMVKGVVENANKAYIVLSGIVLIFLIASILLINNTIKLALYSQRFIIRTMQLVGATDKFIQKPFIKKGLLQGFIAAIFACILIFGIQQTAINQIVGLNYIQNYNSFAGLMLIILILGPLIGMTSTLQSVVRYLKMDLDELY